jgi:uncharacterized protein YjbI with pentapeptide repeats
LELISAVPISLNATAVDADLSGADLGDDELVGADLCGVSLRNAILGTANLHGANVIGADFSGAGLDETILVDLDLSACKGLENCVHYGSSIIYRWNFYVVWVYPTR